MAQLNTAFDASAHDTTARDYEDLPNGIYDLETVAGELKPTSTGGTMLALQYSVIAPENFAGRRIFANMNIENSSAKAQEIGQQELASLCRALELSTINDTDELLLKSFRAKVGMEKQGADPKYKPRNKVVRFYYPDEGDLPPLAVDAAAPAANDNKPAPAAKVAAKPAAAAGSRPWGAK